VGGEKGEGSQKEREEKKAAQVRPKKVVGEHRTKKIVIEGKKGPTERKRHMCL